MTDRYEELERLISRCLDGEASPAERRELERALRNDPTADALFEEYAALDREAARAIRAAVGAPSAVTILRAPNMWREVMFAMAACIALLLWIQPPTRPLTTDTRDASRASWFAPPPTTTDVRMDDARSYERTGVPVADSNSEWIMVPGREPGSYLVIEVKRTRSQLLQLRRDY